MHPRNGGKRSAMPCAILIGEPHGNCCIPLANRKIRCWFLSLGFVQSRAILILSGWAARSTCRNRVRQEYYVQSGPGAVPKIPHEMVLGPIS